MRCGYDPVKDKLVALKHGVSLEHAAEIFDQTYIADRKNDDPERYRAIGWCDGRLCSVIFEIRHDAEGEYYHLIAAWTATPEEEQSYAQNA